MTRDAFAECDIWIFDLDNTLYPSHCNLFPQVAARMTQFIMEEYELTEEQANALRREYYLAHGTTLAGLMARHGLQPERFLDYVHDIDHSVIEPAPELAAAIEPLPGRRFIYTNGSRKHAEDVASKVGVLHLFEDIFDIKAADYVPKPERQAYDMFLAAHGLSPERSAMFEDLPHNLETAHDLGMRTVLVTSDYDDHPSQAEVRERAEPPEHIHHVTTDLTQFLLDLKPTQMGD